MRTITAVFAARTVGLLALAALTAIAPACDDASSPLDPAVPDDGAHQDGTIPTREGLTGSMGGPRYWADGYAFATNGNFPGPYTPSASSSYNRTRGPITVTKTAGKTGRYVVTFSGLSAWLGSKSTVHVTSESNGGFSTNQDVYCKPTAAHLVSDTIQVRCFRASTGEATDGNFRVLVTRNYLDLAFAYAHQRTSSNYRPESRGSWNPAGTSTVLRRGVGQYEVLFDNLGAQLPAGGAGGAGHVQVTAVGTNNAHCKVFDWGGSPGLTVYVRCFNPAGQPADSKFTVLFVTPTDHLAYAMGNQPSTPTYLPPPSHTWNPKRSFTTVTRSAVGRYVVKWDGVNPLILENGTVQVTAFGDVPTQCRANSNGPVGQAVAIACFGPNGAPMDTYFTVLLGS